MFQIGVIQVILGVLYLYIDPFMHQYYLVLIIEIPKEMKACAVNSWEFSSAKDVHCKVIMPEERKEKKKQLKRLLQVQYCMILMHMMGVCKPLT